MDILIFEYTSSGGWTGELPETILPEGLAMVRTLSKDLVRENITVNLPLDYRLWNYKELFSHCNTIKVPKDKVGKNIKKFLKSEFKSNDATFLIAPESDQILFNLTSFAEKILPVLSVPSHVVSLTSSKWNTMSLAAKSDLAIPKSYIEQDGFEHINWKRYETIKLPLIVKPNIGCGADGCTLVRKREFLKAAFQEAFSLSKEVLCQEYIHGTHISTSFIVSNNSYLFLTLNLQNMTLSETPGQTSEYLGGLIPFEHALNNQIRSKTEILANKISGLKGYSGMDFVFQGNKIFFMEINPRLTTSYVGISSVAKKNLGLILVKSGFNEPIPSVFETQGFTYFGKVSVHPLLSDHDPILDMPEVIIPPIYGPSGQRSGVFLRCTDNSSSVAKKKFDRIAQQLINPFN